MIFIGDIHGNFNRLNSIFRGTIITDTTFIQVGDFGIGYHKHEHMLIVLENINKTLKSKNNNLLVIRGNHDDPKYFDGNFKFSNIEFLKDYTVRTIDNKNVLFIGGGISIDRVYSVATKGKWWKDEIVNFDFERLKEFRNIDIVVTHSAPNFVEPFGVNAPIVERFAKNDSTLKQQLLEERMNFTKVYEILKENNYIKEWIYGHFHHSNTMYVDSTKFVLLDIEELYETN